MAKLIGRALTISESQRSGERSTSIRATEKKQYHRYSRNTLSDKCRSSGLGKQEFPHLRSLEIMREHDGVEDNFGQSLAKTWQVGRSLEHLAKLARRRDKYANA